MSKVTLTDVQTGYRVTSVINDNNATTEAAFDNTLSRDGSTPNSMEAPIDLAGHKVLNVAAGTAASDAVNKAQLDSFAANLPQSAIDQIAAQVAVILGGDVEVPPTYVNPPAPTTVVAAVVTYASVTVTLTMSDTTWAEGYNIYRVGSGLVGTIRNPATFVFTDTTVAPLTTYRYEVSAYNDTYDYESARTQSNVVTTPVSDLATVPAVPTSLAASEVSPGTIRLTWAYNSAVPVEAFTLKLNGSFEGIFEDPTVRLMTIGGLTPGVTYSYSLSSFSSAGGSSAFAAFPSVTIAIPATGGVPATPVITSVTATSSTSLRVRWTHDGVNLNGWRISISGPNGYYQESTPQALSSREYTFDSLIPSTTYSVAVSAVRITSFNPPVPEFYTDIEVGTTSAGAVVTPLEVIVFNNAISGVVGSSIAGNTPVTATGGVTGATYAYSITSAKPSWLTLNSSTGAWGGTPTTTINNQTLVVSVTDGVGSDTTNVSLNVTATTLAVTRPSGLADGGTIVATQSSALSGITWTFAGAQAPYLNPSISGLPAALTNAGLSIVTTSTSIGITGTPTLTLPNVYPITVTVTSTDGQVFDETYNFDYRITPGAINNPPVISASNLNRTVFSETAYTGATPLTVVSATDPDGDVVTLSLVSVVNTSSQGSTTLAFTGPVSNVYTVTATGTTFDRSTGKVEGTYDEAYNNTSFDYVCAADDGVSSTAFTVASTVPATFTASVSAAPTDVGVIASGGDGTPFTYALSGTTPPAFLGTFSTSTGLFTGGTAPVAASSTTGIIMSATQTSVTRSVTISVTVNATSANDFLSRVPGTLRATNFQYVYLNGNTTPARTITSEGDPARYGRDAGTMFLEACGGNNLEHFHWINDPTGYQTKVMSGTIINTTPGDIGFMSRLDGTTASVSSSGGTVYPRIFYQWRAWYPRSLMAYRDPTTTGGMKLGYMAPDFTPGQFIVSYDDFTGFLRAKIWGAGNTVIQQGSTNSIYNPNGVYNYPYTHEIPTPNPWHQTQSTNDGRIYQAAGPWGAALGPNPPTGTTAADKYAYHRYYGLLVGSSGRGLAPELGSLGINGTTSAGVNTPWLDEREHKIGGVTVGWPAQPVIDAGVPYIHMDEWNTIQMYFERNSDLSGRVTVWHSYAETAPKLVCDVRVTWKSNSDATLASHRLMGVFCQDTDREADPNRPESTILWGEMISSLSVIKMPGNHTPLFSF